MKVTNKLNLPSAFVNLSEDIRKPKEDSFSATEILKPIREILLNHRHFDDITVDVADRVWLIFGTAVHKILEEADHSGYAEVRLETQITKDYKLTGICDLFNELLFAVEDYKTASVWKVIHQDFDDWKKQGLIYAYLLRLKGKLVTKLRFHALLKDWSPNDKKLADLRGSFYPDHPIWTWEYEITEDDMTFIKDFIFTKFKALIEAKKLADNDLPICSPEDRWNTGDKYAVYLKAGSKRANKVCDTEEEAHEYISRNGGAGQIEIRKGEDKKCKHYCQCCEFCNYYQEHVKEEL